MVKMAFNKELIDFIQNADYKTLTTGKDKNGTTYLQHIFEIHAQYYGEVCTGCPNKIPTYISRVKAINIQEMEKNISTQLFRLKKGVTIPIFGTSKVFSEFNLSDEDAIKLLKENPNRRHLFAVLPKNINDILEGKSSTNEEQEEDEKVNVLGKDFSIEDSRQLLSKIGVSTKAKTVRGIQDKVNSLSKSQLDELEKLVKADN